MIIGRPISAKRNFREQKSMGQRVHGDIYSMDAVGLP
jgi:hypothetical protein